MHSDSVLIALGMHYPDLSEMLRAEIVRTAENNPHATRDDFIADIARHFAAQVEPEVPDHPDHVDCADGCGLAVTHDGACLDQPGGRVVCTSDNHESMMCSNCRDAVTFDDEDSTWVGSDGEVNCPESSRPHGPAVPDDADEEDAGPLWTCPGGCGWVTSESDADMIVDHVRDCDLVDGAGQRR